MNIMSLILFVICSLVTVVFSNNNQINTVIVETPSGLIKGIQNTFPENGVQVNEFRGIRYGKAPIGPLRFRKPTPVEKWADTFDATKFGAACPQLELDFLPGYKKLDMSEDCLFLNVYVPKVLNPYKKLSVMVWIHGGGLSMGHAHEYDGGRIATQGDVIVVTINYRLGIFGFFALDHPAAKGNYGVWDQKLALQWTHDNIAAFGGDPGSVTIFGESAGGWSVNVQPMIPSNKGLFQRAISQSGAFDFGRTFTLKPKMLRKYAEDYANKTGCSLDDLYKFTHCLREVSVDELIDMTNPMKTNPVDRIPLETTSSGVVDGELFTDNPFRLLSDKTSDVAKFFKSIDFMGGTTSNEGSLLYMIAPPSFLEHFGFNMTEGIPSKVACVGIIAPFVELYLNNNPALKTQLCDFYTVDGSVAEQGLRVSELFGDLLITYPVVRMLEYHSSLGGETWQYRFSKTSPSPIGGPPPSWFKGSGHADELIFMFSSNPFTSPDASLSEDEKELSKHMINYWTSFAKSRNPNEGGEPVKWKQFTLKDRDYVNLDVPISADTFMASDSVQFWTELYQNYEFEASGGLNEHDEL
ncbi:fatty acyl-CoA hydrolase precursor, medium chain-like [Mytilus edulis]|uniref:fatty acyl-CoA hydrolase precursor, medium chain-like n=1 Tax=Mytilus edulis TaxID=6550 RepID=UPI0039EEE129